MNKVEVLKFINDGANFYCRQLGNATHMNFIDNGYYSMIYPKHGQVGGTSIFNIRLDHFSDAEVIQKVNEIKSKNVHTWWGICLSDRLSDFIWGKDRPKLTPEEHENAEELNMALLPEDKLEYCPPNNKIIIKQVTTLDEFGIWTDICNLVLHNSFPIIHNINHFELNKNNIMTCYIGYMDGQPAAVSAILNNDDVSSLEFVATLESYRYHGLARALCEKSVHDAFLNGSKIITTRAFKEAKNLYKSIGFKTYF